MRALAAFAFLIGLAGCASGIAPAPPPADVPARAQINDVPLIQQADFHCGPAAVAMVMGVAGADVTQAQIAALAFSPAARGTYLADMVGVSRRLGQLAVPVSGRDDLLAEVAAGHPVIVFQNLGFRFLPIWHYAVVTGYDLTANQVTLHSGQRDRMIMPMRAFMRSWALGDEWAIVVLPPDRLPATANETSVLAAAAGLERAGQYAAAQTAYESGAARWPDNWLWSFGLGNARYAAGDLAGARRALLQARGMAPDIPEIGANLATVNAALATL